MYGVAKTGGVCAPGTGIHAQRKRVMERLVTERRKLENMIMEAFLRGRGNLGVDREILEQSRKMDLLVVDEMVLEEMLKKSTH
jgi:hypothetical protein